PPPARMRTWSRPASSTRSRSPAPPWRTPPPSPPCSSRPRPWSSRRRKRKSRPPRATATATPTEAPFRGEAPVSRQGTGASPFPRTGKPGRRGSGLLGCRGDGAGGPVLRSEFRGLQGPQLRHQTQPVVLPPALGDPAVAVEAEDGRPRHGHLLPGVGDAQELALLGPLPGPPRAHPVALGELVLDAEGEVEAVPPHLHHAPHVVQPDHVLLMRRVVVPVVLRDHPGHQG